MLSAWVLPSKMEDESLKDNVVELRQPGDELVQCLQFLFSSVQVCKEEKIT